MEHCTEPSLFPLLLVSFLAFLIPIITAWFSKSTKLPVPAVVGEIICGIIIGKSALGLINSVESIPWLDFLSLFGFTYLMFLSGLEIDFGIILSENVASRLSIEKKKLFKQPLTQAISYFLITLILATGIALVLFYYGMISSWAMMTLILSTTSVSVVVPVIKEKLLSKTLLGQTILLSALMADFLTMVLITIVVALHTRSAGTDSLLIIFLIGILIFVVYRLHISRSFDSFINKVSVFKPFFSELSHATTQIKVRGAIALMVLFIVSSQMLGFEIILGAFLAGMLTTLILGESKTHQLEMKLDAIGYGFFIPMFFISVGINLDLNQFFGSEKAWLVLLMLVVSAFAIKIIPAFIFRFNFNTKDSLSAGILLSSRLSLIIAASEIGLKQGLISEEVNAAIVMVAVLTCIISPVIFNRLYDKKVEPKRKKIIIAGAKVISWKLCEELQKHDKEIIIIADKEENYEATKKQGLPVVKSASNIRETLLKAGVNQANTIIATFPQDNLNLSVCDVARDAFGVKQLVAVVNEQENVELFREQDIEPFNKIEKTVEAIHNEIIAPEGYAMFAGHEEEIQVEDVWLTNKDYDDILIKDLKLPGDSLIVYIKRGDVSIVPHGDTELQLYDHLTIAGNPKFIKEACSELDSNI